MEPRFDCFGMIGFSRLSQLGRVVFRPQVQPDRDVQDLLEPLARVGRDLALMPDLP
jgi:hypothetical protein